MLDFADATSAEIQIQIISSPCFVQLAGGQISGLHRNEPEADEGH